MVAKLLIAVVYKTPRPPRPVPPTTGDPDLDADAQRALARNVSAREEHAESLRLVRRYALHSGHQLQLTDDPTVLRDTQPDLVITVGGDGTFLRASRYVTDAAMLGVNSAPSTSTGHYCGATAETLPALVDQLLSAAIVPATLTRLEVQVNGEVVGLPALNDVLFANVSPVASCRYALRDGDASENQLSSGLWIATASGSTAAIKSAGGTPMPVDDPRQQYLVREPYQAERLTLLGRCTPGPIQLLSRGDHNAVFIDGDEDGVPARYGDRVIVSPTAPALRVWGYAPGAR